MKDMKVVKENLGAPVVGPALWISGRVSRPGGPSLCISPLATNASPLDHARRAAGGE